MKKMTIEFMGGMLVHLLLTGCSGTGPSEQGDKVGAPIDRIRAQEIIDYAMENGINYFDSAYVYHGSESEKFLG